MHYQAMLRPPADYTNLSCHVAYGGLPAHETDMLRNAGFTAASEWHHALIVSYIKISEAAIFNIIVNLALDDEYGDAVAATVHPETSHWCRCEVPPEFLQLISEALGEAEYCDEMHSEVPISASVFEGPIVHHEWSINHSAYLPCGCETVATSSLADLPGSHDAILCQTRSSVRCTLHFASCDRCGERLLIVANKSMRRRWVAQAFLQSEGGAWVKANMPPQVVCELGIDPRYVDVAYPTGICTPSPLEERLSSSHGEMSGD